MLFRNRKLFVLNFALILALLGRMFGVVPAVQASTLTVTNTNDSGAGSLRQAIANAVPGDTIKFHSSLAGQTIALVSTLVIDKNLTIDGSSLSSNVKLDGGGNYRVFEVTNTGDLTINSLTVQNGNYTSPCEFPVSCGGGIYSDGLLTITNSTFSGNSAYLGGAIFNRSGTSDIANSTFFGNSATYGGGIFNWTGSMNVTNSTFYGNSASISGGGIYNDVSFLTLTNSTLSGNSAIYGGGLYNAGSLNYTNNILANSTSGGDCYNEDGAGQIVINTSNIVETNAASPNNCGIPTFTTDPKLGTLADNGGFTQTLALLPGSPAINAGDDATCAATDQRGATRPQGSHCDIGAYEYDSAHVDTSIGGLLKGSQDVPPQGSVRPSYAGVDSGPVEVVSTNNIPIVTGLRELFNVSGLPTSSAQMMGLPSSQLSDTYWFPSYNNVTLNEQVRFGNVDVVDTNVTVTIGATSFGPYLLHPNEQMRVNYAGVDSGPVKVQSSGGVKIIAAIRDAWLQGTVVESFSQLMGLPDSQLSDTYWFPAYNNVTLNEQLRFANVGVADTNVTVTIGATSFGPYLLHPNEQFRINYPGVDSGPVKVQSSGGVKIIAAIREAWIQNGTVQSWIQLMGLPAPQLSDTYYFPAYDNVTLNGQLRFGNVDTTNTTVTVTIGGVVKGSYPLTPNQQLRVNYAGLDSGPVVIKSSGGVKIIAALRDALIVNGIVESFAQMMGLPGTQLSDTYMLPAYNNVTLSEELRIGVP